MEPSLSGMQGPAVYCFTGESKRSTRKKKLGERGGGPQGKGGLRLKIVKRPRRRVGSTRGSETHNHFVKKNPSKVKRLA